jgi:hypothetical protein
MSHLTPTTTPVLEHLRLLVTTLPKFYDLGFYMIDPLAMAIGPDQRNDGTQPTGAMILKWENCADPVYVINMQSCHSCDHQPTPNLGLAMMRPSNLGEITCGGWGA